MQLKLQIATLLGCVGFIIFQLGGEIKNAGFDCFQRYCLHNFSLLPCVLARDQRVEVATDKNLVNFFFYLKIPLNRVSLQLFIDSIQVKYVYAYQLKICHQHRISKQEECHSSPPRTLLLKQFSPFYVIGLGFMIRENP